MGRNRHKHKAKVKKSQAHQHKSGQGSHIRTLDANNRFHQGYLSALHQYWNGNAQSTIEEVSNLLMQEPEVEDSILLYRLWVEALAHLGDDAGLRLLKDHLSHLSSEADPFVPSLYALVGMIHFELDEIEAANLIYNTVRQIQDPYVLELRQYLTNRISLQPKSHKQLLSHREALVDYMHFQSLARILCLDGDLQNLNWVFKAVDQFYPGSPLPESFVMQMQIEEQDFTSAVDIANNLKTRFPVNYDFAFYAGYTALKAKKYDEAIAHLSQLNAIKSEKDPDVLCLLGVAHGQLALKNNEAESHNLANQFFNQAMRMFKENGLPITYAKQQKDRLNENFTGTVAVPSGKHKPRYWFVKVSSRIFNELRTSPETDISRITRAMGNQPAPGDVCFVFGDSFSSEKYSDDHSTWRLGAVYTVASEPIWHPYQNFQSDLILENRPKVSVPLLFQHLDRKKTFNKGKHDKGDPRNFGVLEVDGAAVDTILEELAYFSDVNGDLINTLTRLRPAI